MKIVQLFPEAVKSPIRQGLKSILRPALPKFIHYSGVDPLTFAYSQIGVGNFEPEMTDAERYLVRKILPAILATDTPVLCDVGANVGHYVQALAGAFPRAAIYAFEPVPDTFTILSRNVASTPIKCVPLGLSDTKGAATIFLHEQLGGSEHATLVPGVIEKFHQIPKVIETQVQLETLTGFCEAAKLSRLEFVKIDTEGNELRVLQGARSLLEKDAIKAIQFEFNEMNVAARVFLHDFYELLAGFRMYRLLPEGLFALGAYTPRHEIFGFQNILALNEKHLNKIALAPFLK